MEKPCERVHSRLDADALMILERAFDRARRFATGMRLRGGAPVTDAKLAGIIESLIEDALPHARKAI